jgi:glycosyltransferase involved in cell wall biosynthesis
MSTTDAAAPVGERQKWDDYYALLPMVEGDEATRAFGEAFAEQIRELIPPDGKVLEAGCGAGWQSLSLGQAGQRRLTLMDFSAEALGYAKRVFAQHNVSADFVCQDVFAPGEPEHDLVFNAGVLEHYDFDQQVAFLRGMASRSRRYVIALVPNRQCYWYWIWRLHRSSRGAWPFGKEMPMSTLAAAFEAAGLRFLGHWHGGEKWSEFFIKDLDGMESRLREELLAVHCSSVIPMENRGYLVAALGCKDETSYVPAGWTRGIVSRDFVADQLTGAIADALAASVAAEHKRKQAEIAIAEKEKQWRHQLDEQKGISASLADELAVMRKSLSYRVMAPFRLLRAHLAPRGTRRERILRVGWRSLHGDFAYLRRLSLVRTCRAAAQRVGLWLAPAGSLRERGLCKASQKFHHIRCRLASREAMDLAQVLRETADRKGIVIYPPFIDWNWMRQRPHQLMAEFAKAGYLSLFCSPKARLDWFRGFKRLEERLYLCDSLDSLCDLPNPILMASWTGHWETIRRFRAPLVIYDYLDDLGVSSSGGVPNQKKLDLHRKFVTRSDIVLATARRLYDETRRVRPDALYCPNGTDYEHFHLSAPPPVPSDIADLVESGRPIIGYYGALARWFDYELLAHAARAHLDYEFLLIGPNFDRTLLQQPLAKLPNVRWLGQKPYEELPAYLHYFTVATIPFLVNDITKATSPVKLFEYMAGGKPIVTTDMPECREYPCVIVARNAPEYVEMLDEAVCRAGWESHRQAIDREARSNTWGMRARQIIAQLDQIAAQEKMQSA